MIESTENILASLLDGFFIDAKKTNMELFCNI